MSNTAMIMGLGSTDNTPPPAKYLITYSGSTGQVWDIQDDYAEVTSTFKPSNTTSWAASNEHMLHPWQDNGYRSKYIGFGGWGQSSSIGGAIWDVNNATSQWTGYNNYDGTVFSFGGSGSAYVRSVLPHGNSGNFFWFDVEDTAEVNVNKITNPSSSNVSGQASQLITTTTYNAMTWGNYIFYHYHPSSKYVYLASFDKTTGATTNITANTTDIVVTNTAMMPAISKSGNVIVTVSNNATQSNAILMWDKYNITEYTGTAPYNLASPTGLSYPSVSQSTNNIEAVAVSDDDRYVAASYRRSTSPYWGIVVWDRENGNATTNITVPPGSSTNSRPRSITFFPDNDSFIVAGYSGCPTCVCSVSQGKFTKNLSTFSTDAESLISGSVLGATVLPEDWTDGF